MSQHADQHAQEQSKLDALSGKGALKKLLGLMKPYTLQIILCGVLVILLNAADLLKPYIMKIAVDDFLTPRVSEIAGTPLGFFTGTLIGLGVSYFAVILIGALSSLMQARMLTNVCQKILHTLRMRLFDHIHRMPLYELDAMGSGRLLSRATNDVEELDTFYGDVLSGLFRDVFLLIGIVAMMLQMNWRLALMSFVVVPLIAGVTLWCRNALRRNFTQMKLLIGKINGFIAESLSGIRVIQAMSREPQKCAQLHDLDQQYRKTTLFQVMINSVLRPVMEILTAVGTVIILFYGYRLAGLSVTPLEAGVLLAFTNYIKQFFEPINDLAEKFNSVQAALVSADRIFSLLDRDENLEEPDAGTYADEMRGEVAFEDVWFAYEGENWILRGLSFHVAVGEKIAFVGATGAGKTTIISLLSRFYDIQKGRILIDGVPIEDWRLSSLRSQIAVVLQDVFLFVGSIGDNVRINAPIDDDAVYRALQLSRADGFVDALPDGLHHKVAERGATFSTGERQLISFARAIAHDPRILVLDEATANIDSNTELLVQESIAGISENRTAIFIAHRLSTIRACDRIYYLENGEMVEHGTHDQLMAEGGRYAALVLTDALGVGTADEEKPRDDSRDFARRIRSRGDMGEFE